MTKDLQVTETEIPTLFNLLAFDKIADLKKYEPDMITYKKWLAAQDQQSILRYIIKRLAYSMHTKEFEVEDWEKTPFKVKDACIQAMLGTKELLDRSTKKSEVQENG
jgi:hypothetical protein